METSGLEYLLHMKHAGIFTRPVVPEEIPGMEGATGLFLVKDMVDPIHREKLTPMFTQLSNDINAYAEKTHEMLPKRPEDLMDSFFAGQGSIFIAIGKNNEMVPVGHAACVPLYTDNETRVFEFGGWYVNEQYRHKKLKNDMTIGETVGLAAIEQAQNSCQEENVKPVIIATVKRANSLKGLKKLNFNVDSFHKRPFITALTCTCAETSEHFGCPACSNRRGNNNGEIHSADTSGTMQYTFADVIIPNGSDVKKIPCTLLIHGSSDPDEFEGKMKERFTMEQGKSIPYEGVISQPLMQELGQFLRINGGAV